MRSLLCAALLLASGLAAGAEPVRVEAVMTPQQSIRMEFGDGSGHFVLMVRREGAAEGSGAFAGAAVTEYGWHDIDPPRGGDPQGYLELRTGEGDLAYLKWSVKAVFIKGGDKPALFDNGWWELVSGTGRFEGMAGVGSLVIKPAGGDKRRFILDGEVGARP